MSRPAVFEGATGQGNLPQGTRRVWQPEMQNLPRAGKVERRVGDEPLPGWVKDMNTADVERRILGVES